MKTPTIAPPTMPRSIAYKAQEGRHERQRDDARHDEEVDGRDAEGLQGVDSSVTFIAPSCAAKAAPVRPAMRIPTTIAPISRTIAMPTRSAT
jgi:hypothetical protein